MLRADLSPGSPHVMLIVSPERGVAMQYRTTANGLTANVNIISAVIPEWVRLRRDGNLIVGEVSDDGVTWQRVGEAAVSLGASPKAGLAVTSHRRGTLTTAVFEDVLLVP